MGRENVWNRESFLRTSLEKGVLKTIGDLYVAVSRGTQVDKAGFGKIEVQFVESKTGELQKGLSMKRSLVCCKGLRISTTFHLCSFSHGGFLTQL